MSCLCSGSRGAKNVEEFLAETLAIPPDIKDDEHLSKRMFNKISSVISPHEVDRSSAYVNHQATGSNHAAPNMRRMSSIRAPRGPRPSQDGFRISDGESRHVLLRLLRLLALLSNFNWGEAQEL